MPINFKVRDQMRSKKRRIYFRFIKGEALDVTLGLPFILQSKDNWNAKDQAVVSTADSPISKTTVGNINTKLLRFKADVIQAETDADAEGELVNKKWIEDLAAKHFDPVRPKQRDIKFLADFIEAHIEALDVSAGTIKSHNTILKRYKNFEAFENKKYRIREFGPDQAKSFIAYLYGYGESTIAKTVKTIREYIGNAAGKKLRVHDKYKDINYQPSETTVTEQYFTRAEVDKVRDCDYRAQVKNLLLCGLHLGLRVEDLMRINNPKIYKRQGKPLTPPRIDNGNLVLIAKKTGARCVIPLHPDIVDIVPILEPMSDVVFNREIKELAREIGFTNMVYGAKVIATPDGRRKKEGMYERADLIASHCQRRTYITLRKEEGDTEEAIAAATGHKIKGQVAGYNKKTAEEYAEDKKKQWAAELENKV